MKLRFWPGKSMVEMKIISLTHNEGYVDDYERQHSSIRVVLDESENTSEVVAKIHQSVIEQGYLKPESHINESVALALEPEEGRWYSEEYKNNWQRILYIKIHAGFSGLRDPGRYEISLLL